jgi:hypothetical protein
MVMVSALRLEVDAWTVVELVETNDAPDAVTALRAAATTASARRSCRRRLRIPRRVVESHRLTGTPP